MDRNNRTCLSDGRKGMRRPGKIKDVKKKIHARARKYWRRRAEGQVRLYRDRGSAQLRKVASGSAAQGKKVGSQIRCIDQSRLSGKRTIREVRRGGRRRRTASDKAKKRVYRFRVRFG